MAVRNPGVVTHRGADVLMPQKSADVLDGKTFGKPSGTRRSAQAVEIDVRDACLDACPVRRPGKVRPRALRVKEDVAFTSPDFTRPFKDFLRPGGQWDDSGPSGLRNEPGFGVFLDPDAGSTLAGSNP